MPELLLSHTTLIPLCRFHDAEQSLTRLEAGQIVSLKNDAYPDQTSVANTALNQNRWCLTHISVPPYSNPDHKLARCSHMSRRCRSVCTLPDPAATPLSINFCNVVYLVQHKDGDDSDKAKHGQQVL